MVGINHVALEVGDLDAALDLYGRLFDCRLRGHVPGMAFLDMGDQFLALSEGRSAAPDEDRHFGLVVDDRDLVRAALLEAGIEPTATSASPTRGATRSRSSSTATSSSPRPRRCCAGWGSRG